MPKTLNQNITVCFINSFDEEFSIVLSLYNQIDNLMEVIRDNGYEDWGKCGGQSKCGTCHISIDQDTTDAIFDDEEHVLNALLNRTETSRLACQIDIVKTLDGAILRYLGTINQQ